MKSEPRYLKDFAVYVPATKILANWQTCSSFIYNEETSAEEIKSLLKHELLHKDRGMIVGRLKTRLVSLMKQELTNELEEDIRIIRAEA